MTQQQPPPKVKNGQQTLPSYVKTAKPTTAWLPITDRRLYQTDILSLRSGVSTFQVIHDLVIASPDLSAAVFTYLRTAITDSYTVVARNRADGSANPEATQLVLQIINQMNFIGQYADGFSNVLPINTVAEMLLKELVQFGAMSAELVLDKTRLPYKIVPISVMDLKFIQDTDGSDLNPEQYLVGQHIDVDIPTFFYSVLDQDTKNAYPSSPIEAAIQPVIQSVDFQNDLWRVVKRAIHPRLRVKVIEELFKKTIPNDVLHDEEKFKAYLDATIAAIQGMINGLAPEDAIVFFDMMEIDYLTGGNISIDSEYKVLQEILDAKLATGAKVLPSMLGHGHGSQNIASSETMMFMKYAQGLQNNVNGFFSRVFTLAVRLFGQDVYVEFKYDSIDLRPAKELEAFKTQMQNRVLELLSLGLITDEDASLQLTGRLPPPGYTPLQGTGFKTQLAQGVADNPYSNTASQGGVGQTPVGQGAAPKTPKQPAGNPKPQQAKPAPAPAK